MTLILSIRNKTVQIYGVFSFDPNLSDSERLIWLINMAVCGVTEAKIDLGTQKYAQKFILNKKKRIFTRYKIFEEINTSYLIWKNIKGPPK